MMAKKSKMKKAPLKRFTRAINFRDTVQNFLIVCEGGKTEPNYFRLFRVPKIILNIEGTGYNTMSLVDETIQLKNDGEYDQVWCVFDKNSFPADDFNNAITKAQRNDIHVAYSNEAFELWFLLHFNYYDAALSRALYFDKLSELLGCRYAKNSEDMYDQIMHLKDIAIKNARKLLAKYNPHNPANDNPSTTVHLLVEELDRFAR